MSYPFSKLRGLDSKAAGEIAVAVSQEIVAAGIDSFMIDFTSVLNEQLEIISKALAESKQIELTLEAGEIHAELKKTYGDIRKVTRSKIGVKSLLTESTASADLYDVFERHGGAIDKLPRHAFISALANIINEMEDDNGTMLDLAKVTPIYDELVRLYQLLIAKEQERSEISIEEESVPCESEASKQLNGTIRTIYDHIFKYAEIGKEGYGDALAEFDTKLAPIFIHIKALETRHEHEENQENENEIEDTGETEE